MASEATIMAVPGNMHIDARVIGVACIKYEVKFDLQGHLGSLQITKATEATKITVLDKQQHMPQNRSCIILNISSNVFPVGL